MSSLDSSNKDMHCEAQRMFEVPPFGACVFLVSIPGSSLRASERPSEAHHAALAGDRSSHLAGGALEESYWWGVEFWPA